MNYKLFKETFNNQRVLITGHTGFKGTYLTTFFHYLNTKVMGISDDEFKNFKDLKFKLNINSHIFNLNDKKKLLKQAKKFRPKYIFHLAAQSIVYKSIENPSLTWQSNLISTINLLNCLKKINSVKYVLLITTDKVYMNDEKTKYKKEYDFLKGDDSYSMSKVAIENYVKYFIKNNKKFKIITVRAGNVIGGGDWSEKRLIPDIARSIKNKKKLKLRSFKSVRPWVHVLDCIHGYLYLACKMKNQIIKNGSSWNISNSNKNTYDTQSIVKLFQNYFNFKIVNEKKKFAEKKILMLNANKIKNELGWKPLYDFKRCINETINWYQSYISNKKNLTLTNVKKYLSERI